MAFSFVGSYSADAGGLTTFTVNVPAGVQDGDLLVLMATGYASSGNYVAPTAKPWTVVQNTTGSLAAYEKFMLAWRIASGEPASYQVTTSAGNGYPIVFMGAYRGGAGGASPVGGSAERTGAQTLTLAPPAYTAADPGSLFIYGYGGMDGASGAGAAITLPTPGNLLAGSKTTPVVSSGNANSYATLACVGDAGPGDATAASPGIYPVGFVLEWLAPPATTDSAPGYASADAGLAGGAGSWASLGGATGSTGGDPATWTVT